MDRLLTLARPASFGESETVLKRMIGTGIDIVIYMKNFKVIEIRRIIKYSGEKREYESEVLWR
jgi:hypothetical protein